MLNWCLDDFWWMLKLMDVEMEFNIDFHPCSISVLLWSSQCHGGWVEETNYFWGNVIWVKNVPMNLQKWTNSETNPKNKPLSWGPLSCLSSLPQKVHIYIIYIYI
jgi:hypothetical protein